jgi:dTDP-6-deoxy-L-talose 4-dehydrogenase (NAD+)
MNVLVTGATGFIGRHTVTRLLQKGYRVTAVARDATRAMDMPWFDRVHFLACDIHCPDTGPDLFGSQDAVMHLAWPGLPDYKSFVHMEETLPADYRFLKKMICSGIKNLVVTGTCFEYGMQNGMLDENMPTCPTTPYGLAKDSLRKFLEMLRTEHPFAMKWARLFYTYGEGQNPGSLLAQLNGAIDRGDTVFNMSGGEQLRDYLPVEHIAEALVALMESAAFEGIVNVCSGRPVSVRRLVEQHIAHRGASIALNPGYYPYPDYEPMAFWGDVSCLKKVWPTT